MGLLDRDTMFIYNIVYFVAFLSLFAQRKLEPGDGSNELPAGSPLLPLEKKKKKNKIRNTLHTNNNTHHSGKADESGGMQGFELFGIGEEHDYSK